MTKSAVKAMDAISEFSNKEWKAPATKFVVTGASKRGWTSWLTAAADKRVVGIIPMVYDNLNLARQMPHQLEVWGAYSPSISDYTNRDLPSALKTEQGQKLAAMIDPWSYRSRLTMPKFIVNAANDSYWPLDALHLYRDDLPGQTDVLYVPNARHSLGGQEVRVYGSTNGWFTRLVTGQKTPAVRLENQANEKTGGAKFTLRVDSAEQPGGARLWVARSANQDFRKAQWKAQRLDLQSTEKQSVGSAEIAAGTAELPYAAVFAEVDYPVEGSILPMRLSSDVVTWRARSATEGHPAAEKLTID
jgi:PhoPQ-activated pathogenicity-related protein